MNRTENTSDTFWFHCGRCGSLFLSQLGEQEERFCAKCGAKPSLGLESYAPSPALAATSTEDSRDGFVPRRISKSDLRVLKKGRNLMFKIIIGWLVLIVMIILVARRLWHDDSATPGVVNSPDEKNMPEVSQEERLFLERSRPAYSLVFHGFIAAGTQEERNQFVLSPGATAVKMARFYEANPLDRVDVDGVALVQQHILQLPGPKTVETLWKTKDGRKIDVVFREYNGEWRLDWSHYARYSDHPWPLFLAGSGEPEGEFRLLARERLAEERKDAADISMILYAPRFGLPGETGFQSPEFLVRRGSPDGKLLDAAFKNARNGKQAFDSRLANLNPDGMIRVRVRVRRFDEDGTRKFEITRVIAGHWYEVEDPGFKF